MLIVGVASAQTGVPGSGWWSGEQIQNVGTESATVNITAYDKDSTSTYSEDVSLAAGASVTFVPHSYFSGMPSGFIGSAVVRADQPIKGITNVTNVESGDFGVSGGRAAAQYQGTDGSAVADTLYFPLAKGDHYGKTTTFYIQNASSSADASNVVATFTMRNGDVHTYNVPTIGPNQMVLFSVHDTATFSPSTNDGRVGSLMVTGGQALAGVVMEHDTTGDPALVLNSTRGFTANDFATKAYAPVIKKDRFDRFTGLQVQNVSGGAIDITVSYIGTAGSCAGDTYTDTATDVADGTSHTFVHLTGNTDLPSDCVASATVEATGSFVAIVNEQQTEGDPFGITYSAMSDAAATTKVSIPLFKDNRYGATSGLQIQNVGTADTTNWTATFVCSGGASFTAKSDDASTGQIAQGGAYLFFTPSDDSVFAAANPFASDNVNCAVTIEADQPLVAIVNEMGWGGNQGAVDDNNYEGFNLAP